MKLFLRFLAIVALAVVAVSCHDSKNEPTPPPVTPPEPPTETKTVPNGRVCIAYAPYYRNRLPDPTLVTHICFSFAEVYVRDNVYKGFKLQGDNNEAALKRVIALRDKNPNLKILLSFSHTVVNSDNYQDGGFSAIAADENNRRKFANDCLAFIKNWNLQGIDLDWEMPGISWSGAKADPMNDTDNFTLLVKQLRTTLGKNNLITLAGYVMDKKKQDNGKGWKYFDLKAIKPYLDWVNIMTYDFDDSSNGHRGFQSGVNSRSGSGNNKSYWDIESTMAEYATAGYDSTQMVLGIPFYVRISFDSSPSVIDYCDFNKNTSYKYDNWDDLAMTPYITLNGAFKGSYDNPKSIALKGEKYIGGGRVRGLMYWDAGGDDANYTLSKACWNAVLKQ